MGCCDQDDEFSGSIQGCDVLPSGAILVFEAKLWFSFMGVKLSLSEKGEHRWRVFKNKVVKRMFNLRENGTRGCEEVCNGELLKLSDHGRRRQAVHVAYV